MSAEGTLCVGRVLEFSRDGGGVQIAATSPGGSGDDDAITNVEIAELRVLIFQFQDSIFGDEDFVFLYLICVSTTRITTAARIPAATTRIATSGSSSATGIAAARIPAATTWITTTTSASATPPSSACAVWRGGVVGSFDCISDLKCFLLRIDLGDFRGADNLCLIRAFVLTLILIVF